jgi:hypothetical protein
MGAIHRFWLWTPSSKFIINWMIGKRTTDDSQG